MEIKYNTITIFPMNNEGSQKSPYAMKNKQVSDRKKGTESSVEI